MSAEKFEQVLEFSRSYAQALDSAPSALHDVLECVVCNSLLVSPYTLRCGHTFCGNCLALWFKERVLDASCPTCRDRVTTEPVPNLALRQLALAVIESWNANPTRETLELPGTEMSLARGEKLFAGVRQREPVFDNEDGVYRCPACDHEIENGGTCSGCGLQFADFDESYNDSSDNIDSDEDSSEPVLRGHARWRDPSSDVANSDEMDSDDMNFVVDDDEVEDFGSEAYENHSERSSSSDSSPRRLEIEVEDSSDDDDIEVTDVRQSAPRASNRAIVIDDDSD